MLTLYYSPRMTSIDNETERASGHADVPLSPLGRQLAQELGQHYAREVLDVVFCSDLQRAATTARIAFAGRALPIVPDSRLREYDYGDLTQCPTARVEEELPRRITEPFPHGESLLMVVQRVGTFLRDALREYDEKAIVVIGHRATRYGLEYWCGDASLEDIVRTPWEWREIPIWRYELHAYHLEQRSVAGETHSNDSREKRVRQTRRPRRCSNRRQIRPRKRVMQTDQAAQHYFDLTPEQRDLRERVRAYVRGYVAPRADETDRLSRFPEQAVARAAELGFLGLLVPREYGGREAGHVAFAIFVEEVAYACAASAVIMDVHSSVGTEPIVLRGDEDQKRRYLPLLASGGLLGAFALTEPEAGSDAASLKTTAVRDGDHYVLNGAKTFITNAGRAGLYTAMAATDGPRGARSISAFLVEADTPGLAVGAPLHKLGLHGSPTCELSFRDCRVPAANRLGQEGEGFKIAMLALDSGRIGISAQAIGLARAALDECIAALTETGKPVSQGTQFALADMATAVEAARALTWQAARLCDLGRPFSAAAAMAKLVATDTAMQVTSEADRAARDSGVPNSSAHLARLDRFFRDAKATQLYEGTNQIQRLVIARHVLQP